MLSTTYYSDLEKSKQIIRTFKNLTNSRYKKINAEILEPSQSSKEEVSLDLEANENQLKDKQKDELNKQESKLAIQISKKKTEFDGYEDMSQRTPIVRRIDRKQTFRGLLMTVNDKFITLNRMIMIENFTSHSSNIICVQKPQFYPTYSTAWSNWSSLPIQHSILTTVDALVVCDKFDFQSENSLLYYFTLWTSFSNA